MNKHVLFVAVTILILGGTGIVSQAYAAFTITMETDKDVYDHSSVITVTGTVDPIDENEIPVTIMLVNQYTSIVVIAQLDVNNDGSWSGQIHLNPANSLMSEDGVYEIRAQYGSTKITTSIELTNAVETSEEVETETAVTAVTGTTVTGPSGESFYKLSAGK